MGMSDADVFWVLDKLTRKAYEEKLLGKSVKLLGWRGKLLGGKSSARKEPC